MDEIEPVVSRRALSGPCTVTRQYHGDDVTWHATCQQCRTVTIHTTLLAAEHWATRTHQCEPRRSA